MALTTAIPVRFTPETDARLRGVSESTGIPVAQLIRIATDSYLAEIERSGKVTVPLVRETPVHYGKKKARSGASSSGGEQL